mmetsp:Transcript_14404/g.42890  ORF Transcript_14404/g.42890 Transcript_14404/m.42890 type:complete len:345 (-) Transcript_14404:167-1201(-)
MGPLHRARRETLKRVCVDSRPRARGDARARPAPLLSTSGRRSQFQAALRGRGTSLAPLPQHLAIPVVLAADVARVAPEVGRLAVVAHEDELQDRPRAAVRGRDAVLCRVHAHHHHGVGVGAHLVHNTLGIPVRHVARRVVVHGHGELQVLPRHRVHLQVRVAGHTPALRAVLAELDGEVRGPHLPLAVHGGDPAPEGLVAVDEPVEAGAAGVVVQHVAAQSVHAVQVAVRLDVLGPPEALRLRLDGRPGVGVEEVLPVDDVVVCLVLLVLRGEALQRGAVDAGDRRGRWRQLIRGRVVGGRAAPLQRALQAATDELPRLRAAEGPQRREELRRAGGEPRLRELL